MRAMMYGAGDVRGEDVPDPAITAPTDAVVRVLMSCICGYRAMDERTSLELLVRP